jgi:hypothetical protein
MPESLAGKAASRYHGVSGLLHEAELDECPGAKAVAFVGNAWDPQTARTGGWVRSRIGG